MVQTEHLNNPRSAIVGDMVAGVGTIVIDPPEFKGTLQVRREGRRLLVYALEAEAEPLLAWLGPGLADLAEPDT